MEDQGCVEGEEVRELGIKREIFEDREVVLDVLQRRNLRGDKVLQYPNPLGYFDPEYISNH